MSTTSRFRVLVLGGGYAGLTAAARAAKSGARVTVVDGRPSLVQRIRLHQVLAGEHVASVPLRPLLARRGIDFEHAHVDGVDLDRREVVVRAEVGRHFKLGWDALILATGSRVAAPVPGVAAHAVRLEDPLALRGAHARLRAMPARGRVTIVGGGATAIETAAELAERFPRLRLTMIAPGGLGPWYAPGAARYLHDWFSSRGVVLRDAAVDAVERDRAMLRDGTSPAHDLLVWGGGFEASPVARDAGLAVAADGRAIVEPTLRAVGHDLVFVAGDSAWLSTSAGTIRMGCATAAPIGARAGDNVRRALTGREMEPFRWGFVFRCLSLGRRDGLITFTNPDDTPTERYLTGRQAALMKELVSRGTIWAVKAELGLSLPVTSWSTPLAAEPPSSLGILTEGRAA